MTAYHCVHVACSIIIMYRPIGSSQWLGLSVRFALYIALKLLMFLVPRSEGTNINGVFLPDSLPWRLKGFHSLLSSAFQTWGSGVPAPYSMSYCAAKHFMTPSAHHTY